MNSIDMSARHNQSTSRNRSSEISQATSETNEREPFQNEIIFLKKEVEDLKKEHPTNRQITARRQAHSSPTSKPPPQKKKIPTTIQKTKRGSPEELETDSSRSK